VTQFAVAVTIQNEVHDLLLSDWSQPRRSGSLYIHSALCSDETKNVWQSIACSPRGIAASSLAIVVKQTCEYSSPHKTDY